MTPVVVLPRQGDVAPCWTEESARLAALDAYHVVHTCEEAEYDELVELAAAVTSAPVATFSLLTADEQWFKARIGMQIDVIPRELAFCRHLLAEPNTPLVIPDTTCDPRVRDNPYVTGPAGLRAYLGVAVKGACDEPLGTLAVLDTRARPWTKDHIHRLSILGRMAEAHLELRRALAAAPAPW